MTVNDPSSLRVDVAFRASAQGALPLEHSYPLFAALSRHDPRFHESDWLAVHPLSGQPLGDTLTLWPQRSALRLRVPPEKISEVISLAGKNLEVAGIQILLGVSQLYMLRPSSQIVSRIVTIKGYTEPEPFAERIKKELKDRSISATVEVGRRRVISVAKDKIIGFALRLSDLNENDSLSLQYTGLGGRQHFGCGIFSPSTREVRSV